MGTPWRHVKPLPDRFWPKVTKTDDCWLWTGARSAGYGVLRRGRSQSNELAHRLSWQLHNGSIPDGLFVCHRCDVRLCVRPDHLFLGTNADNIRDAVSKGRVDYHAIGRHTKNRRRGQNHWAAVLTANDIETIRADRAQGYTYRAIGAAYGITPTQVCRIIKGHSWAHV